MNKIYGKVWSRALNQLVVVSELATCHRSAGQGQQAADGPSSPRLAPRLLMTALAALGGVAWALPAAAQTVDCTAAPYNLYNSATSCMGYGAIASGLGATAIGGSARTDLLGGVALGYSSYSAGQNSLSLGFQAYSSQINSIYLGARTGPTTGALAAGAIAIGTDVTSSGTNAIGMGSTAKAVGGNAVAIGALSSVDANSGNSVAIGPAAGVSNAINAVALGASAVASTGQGTALGAFTKATSDGALAAGLSAQALNTHSTAVGWQAYATALNAVYLGARTVGTGASAESAIGIGTDVSASGTYAIGMGIQANASNASSIAIGRQAAASGAAAIAMGGDGTAAATASGGNSISIGVRSSAVSANAAAIGYDVHATMANSSAFGVSTSATGTGAIALGNNSTASDVNAVVLGTSTTASKTNAAAVGTLANASAINSTALGVLAQATNTSATALGGGGTNAATAVRASGTGALAAGGNATAGADAAGDNSIALGGQSTATQANAIAIGLSSNAAAANATAIGNAAQALAASTVAFGDSNTVAAGAGTGAIAGGHNSRVTAGTGAVALGEGQTASGNGAVAIGDPNTATGNGAVALGADNTANGNGAVALGNTNTAQGLGSVAIGNGSGALANASIALGNGATANFANDVALGSASVTAAVVGTSSAVINGQTYNFAGTGPDSTVSVGFVGGERTITNVAAGRISNSSTDAINGSQLNATNLALESLSSAVTAGATHYYSVNDGGTAGGNYANNGATGLDALAAGVGASAVANNGTSLGQNTATSVLGGVALGSGSVSDRAIAPASGSILVGTHVIPYDTTDRNLLGAVSVGNATDFRQITNVADGTQDQDAVTLRQLKGAIGSFSVTPTKYFHANSNASDSLAAGAESVAIGPQTTVNGDNGVGLGNGAIVQQAAPGGTAIGQNATVNLADGVALGTNATSNGIQAMALGAGSQAAFAGSVALGAGSVTEAAVATATETINGTSYNVAGTAPGSTISVGTAGAERTITHVAAGRVDAASTDAINGSQLFATNQAIGTVGTNINNLGTSIANSYGGNTTYNAATGAITTSITYGGNTYSSLQQVFNQIDTGGIKYFHANSNLADSLAIGVNSVAIGPVSTASATNAVSIGNGATAAANTGDVALGAGSTTATVVGTGSGAIAGQTYTYAGATPTSTVSVGTLGNERTITNVAAGRVDASSTDAINGSQLYATNQAVDALNTTVAANAAHYYSVNDGGITGGNYSNNGATGLDAVAAGVGASAVADNGTSLGQNTATSVTGGVALGSGSVSDRAVAPASGSILVGTHVVPYNTTDRNLLGAVSVGNATDFRQITNVADGTLDQDAVTLRQLKGAMSSFSVTPTKYFHANSSASDSLAAGAESVAIGPQTTVNGDNGIGMGNGAIVQQTAPGGTAIGQNATVNLADGVALGTNATSNGIQAMALGAGSEATTAGSVALGAGSVTAAAVATTSETLNGTTYAFAGSSPGSTVSIGSVGAERTLTNLAAGRISGTSTDAINGSQLYATNLTLQQLNNALSNLSQTVNNLPGSNSGGNVGGSAGNTVNTYQTSGDNTTAAAATGSNATAAGAGATASGSSSTAVGSNASASAENSVALGAGSVATTANSVSVGSVGHERAVTNVAAGVNATDAVNVGQLSDAVANAKDWSKNYTDERFNTVDQNLNRIGNRANAGVASAMAMASLPQAYQPNQNSAGVALGSFHGEASIAVGVSTISESGRYVFKLNATTNTRGDAGAGVGAGMVW